MAQLRDKKTSQIIFEGTPLEAAKLAEELGTDQVLFDDVGPGFDHKAVLASHEDEVSYLHDLVKSKNKDAKQDAQAKLKDFDRLKSELPKTQKEVEAALQDARANIG